MKKMLVIVGGGVIAGAVVYVLWNKIHGTEGNIAIVPKKEPIDIISDNSISVTSNNFYEKNDKLSNMKASLINTISERHEEASKIIKGVAGVIYKKSEVLEEEKRNLKQISDGLDELLREE